MRVDQLMDAIEEIDDRYIEESAYGVKRKRNIPWGMIITAACFCLAIGATMFMQGLGILPHLSGTTATTVQPTTTEPSATTEPGNTTEPIETTNPEDDAAVLEEIKALFDDKNGWYYRALVDEFESAEYLHLRYYFCNSTEFGEGLQPTKQEMDELMAWEEYQEGTTLTILPVSKMDAILTEVFDITVAEMDNVAFAGLKYVESIDSWCFWGGGTLNVNTRPIQHVEKVAGDIYRVVYKMPYIVPELSFNPRYESYEIRVKVYGDSCHILSNILIENNEQPTEPPESRPSVEEFFSDRENWQNLLILPDFSDATQFDLRPIYLRAMDGESTYATDLEHEKLASVIPGYSRDKLFRATKAQLDELMLAIFNITTDQLASDWEDNFTYLEETGCYYARLDNSRGYTVYIDRTEDCSDGTVLMYYALARGEDPYLVARLQPHDTGYYILSNERYVDNTGKSDDQIAMEELFKGSSWFNQALTCEYDSPEQIGILSFFYCGIPGESKITDEEKAQLKNMQGFGTPAGDICRLHPDKMNAVLTECFGITLEDVDPTGFNSLAYLESTNCYYFKASSPNFVENFKADRVERNSDRTIDVYYNISYKGDYVVTVKPHGDSYRILSNRCINSTPLIPPTPTEPTGDTELEKLFAGYRELPEKELSQKMVDAFLADPDTFVQLLAKQDRYYGILLGVLSRNVTDNHPQIAAYRAAVGSLLAKELPEKETLIVKGMAVYSGISNYFPDEPTADDYVKLLDIIQHYSHEGECNELLRRYCIADPRGVLEQIVLTEIGSYSFYTERLTFLAPQEELKQLKQAMTQLISELKTSSDSRAQDQIKCAQQIIESCDKEIE